MPTIAVTMQSSAVIMHTTKKTFGIVPRTVSLLSEPYEPSLNTERNVSLARKVKNPSICIHDVYTTGSVSARPHSLKRSENENSGTPADAWRYDADAPGDAAISNAMKMRAAPDATNKVFTFPPDLSPQNVLIKVIGGRGRKITQR